MERLQDADVEDVVDARLGGKLQMVSHVADALHDFEWAVETWRQLV